ncbi:hypothetical protein CHS0354_040375 [Potamilus streckersoni]|uniref:Uncharacterized protein n=1 Tax=Potamilus streckersoni TaxID=2493646 RepID=A0AAE0VM78_9BIVA|nr:hypothetical protein CHS0354_040375 [Potamilus streckersoni]
MSGFLALQGYVSVGISIYDTISTPLLFGYKTKYHRVHDMIWKADDGMRTKRKARSFGCT